ncbi:hypothetical protein VE03_01187 [Pseudogymnoascus sp. 23342-1-I1]|nr:hypothetical protein VE03_01187 [Pseudogymnoascus sp. 23342-1-I1]
MNGIAAYGANLIPAAGTFLNFVSYAAGAVRLSALGRNRVIWIATHDSGRMGLLTNPLRHWLISEQCQTFMFGGPQTAYLSAISATATPSIIALTRQPLPHLEGSTIENASRGGYVIHEDKDASITLVSTGSEVSLCQNAVTTLQDKNDVKARVISMPCQEVFDMQPQDYQLSVLKPGIPIMSVEPQSNQRGAGRNTLTYSLVSTDSAQVPHAKIYLKNFK